NTQPTKQFFQLHNRYVVSQIVSGFMLIDQQAAHERILFEQFQQQLIDSQGVSQQSLFPQTVAFNPRDFSLLDDMIPEILALVFQLRPFGKNTYIVDGVPADLENINESQLIERLLEDFKSQSDLRLNKRDRLAKSLARQAAIKAGTKLDTESMAELIDRLFACQSPSISLAGRPIIITFTLQELAERFGKAQSY